MVKWMFLFLKIYFVIYINSSNFSALDMSMPVNHLHLFFIISHVGIILSESALLMDLKSYVTWLI